MSLEPVQMKNEVEEKYESKSELLQTPDGASSAAETSKARSVKQELIETPTKECSKTGTELIPSNSYQDCVVKQEFKLDPKQESVNEENEEWWCGVSAEAAQAGLYAGHVVKRELVLGPELLQAPLVDSIQVTKTPETQIVTHVPKAEGASGENQPSKEPTRRKRANTTEKRKLLQKPCWCDICNREFSQGSDLTRHMRLHTVKKHYTCDVCDKKFTSSHSVTQHKRIHTGEKPYSCSTCNKQFARKDNLHEHQRIHTGERKYVCDVCNKQFTFKNNLNDHKRIHSGDRRYPCNMCDKQFTYIHCLKKHKLVHSGEKPYVCDVCNHQCARKDNLKHHKLIHTEKLYTCDICKKQFVKECRLSRHYLTHAKDKPKVRKRIKKT